MAATNYTPIQLYFSTTASAVPLAANLAQGELAINITDGKLYYEDNAGAVQVIATKGAGTIGGSTTQIQYNNAGALAGNAAMVFNNSTNVTTLTTLNLTNALGAIYGGTAQSTYAQGDVLYASASNTLAKLGIGATNYILTSTGTVPQWVAPSSIAVLTATNLAGGLAGSVPYQSAVDTTTFLAIGAANRVMTSTGAAPQWVTSLTGLTGVSSSSITNTSLTSGRVVVSTTGGAQADDADLTFDGTTLSAGGYSTAGLSTLVKTVTIGNSSFNGTAVFAAATPAKLYIGTGTVTDTTSAIGATNAVGAISSLAITPIAATNTTVTYTNAATLYIAGAPSAGTNVTLTNPYSLYVAAGAAYFGGAVTVAGSLSLAGVTVTSLTDSGLTSGRVTYAGTGGLLQDSANLTFNGTTLTANTIGAFTLGGTVAGGGNQLNNVVIGTTTPLAGNFTTLSAAWGGYANGTYALTIGADIGDNSTRTNATRKVGSSCVPHYTNAEEPLALIIGDSSATENNIYIGGAYSGFNAATSVNIYAAANNTTATGSLVARFTSTGLAVTGTLSATGMISTTVTNQIFDATGTSTSPKYGQIGNGAGLLSFGVEGSAGGALITGTSAYDTAFTAGTGRGIAFGVTSGAMWARLTATGLAVTGTVSATTSSSNRGFTALGGGDSDGRGNFQSSDGGGTNFFTFGRDNLSGGFVLYRGATKVYGISEADSALTYTGAVAVTGPTEGTALSVRDVIGNGNLLVRFQAGSITTLDYGGSGNQFTINTASTERVRLDASGNLSIASTTDATSTTAASLKTAGGLAVAKTAYIGGAVHVGTHARVSETIAGAITSGSAQTIYTIPNAFPSSSLVLVTGIDGSNNWFSDLVHCLANNSATTVSSGAAGSPGTRTYTMSTTLLQLNPSVTQTSVNVTECATAKP